LGGRTVPAKIMAATKTHDVFMLFFGLSSPEQHIARVKARVAAQVATTFLKPRYESVIPRHSKTLSR